MPGMASSLAERAVNGLRGERKKCGVLGCTGLLLTPEFVMPSHSDFVEGSVGQKFIQLLADHPVLQLHAIGASSRSAGKKYKEAVRWKQTKPMSPQLAALEVRECKANLFQDCDLVFSGLDSDVAGEIGRY